jgi:hypothetical protein
MAWVYLDTETHLIAPGKLAPKLVCVQIAEDGGEVEIHLASDPRTREVVAKAFQAFRIVGHNISFDLAVLCEAYPDLAPEVWRAYDEGRVCDTMIAAQLFDIAKGELKRARGSYSLKGLAQRFCDVEMLKGEDAWQLRYAELDGVPLDQWPEEAVTYAKLDVAATRKVWLVLGYNDSMSDGATRIPTFDVQVRAAWALHLASVWGMRCEGREVTRLVAHLNSVQNKLRHRLIESGLLRDNGTRDDKAVRARAEACGAKKKTKGGQTSISAASLQDVDDAVLRDLATYQNAGKVRSTYLPVVQRGVSEPIHARYGLVESGRTSCSGPNLQNLPRTGRVRECFVPSKPGYVFVAADYSVIELVCLAQVLVTWFGRENSEMARQLNAGRDLHLYTASSILDLTYEETLARYKAGDKAAKEARQLAKGLNFGIPGGLGAEKLRQLLRGYGFEVTVERAQELKKLWLERFPEMGLYFSKIAGYANAVSGWETETFTMRHVSTGFVRGGLNYTAAANHQFQHLASYGAKRAVYSVQRSCFAKQGPLANCRLVAFIHDELLLEVPEEKCDEAARELSSIMVVEFMHATPDVPVQAEALAMRRWCKDAKPQRDSTGKLIPWVEHG